MAREKQRNSYRKGAVPGGAVIPAQRDCGPSVDTWPILDSEGESISQEAEEEEEE